MTEEEIESVSKLVRIKVADHREHIEKVRDMINFFEMLDSAGVEDDELVMDDVPVSRLREDAHESFGGLSGYVREYRDGYVRVPKMD
ncbi:MAG: hypothetical protein OXP12_09415 [Thaumarchaeota archaeon]|nr:hypothetical protein [Nitrososphaerota archaeon]MDE0266283.1 hypothetical protein [Nitrososphaerota archaeon]MDE0526633.1 hypothetical protein [Nitrososphaerota archaeon]